MTDTGPVPGEGLPETNGAPADGSHAGQSGAAPAGPHGHHWSTDAFLAPATPAFVYGVPPETGEQSVLPGDFEDEQLLMPGPQSGWSDPRFVPPPAPAPSQSGHPGDLPVPPDAYQQYPVNENYSAAPAPQAHPQQPVEATGPEPFVPAQAAPPSLPPQDPAAPADASLPPADQPPPPRRPLNLGPPQAPGTPVPGESTSGVSVRSLADRGPTPPPAQPVPQAAPQPEPVVIPGQQNAEAPAPATGWGPQDTAAVAGNPQPVAADEPGGLADLDREPPAGVAEPAPDTPADPVPQPAPAAPAPDAAQPEAEAPPFTPDAVVPDVVAPEPALPEAVRPEAVEAEPVRAAVAPEPAQAVAPEAVAPEASPRGGAGRRT